jgi:arginyl-tRNA synthetase
MIELLKEQLNHLLTTYYKDQYQEMIPIVVEEPKNTQLGDLAIPVFVIAKTLKKPFPVCGQELKDVILISEYHTVIHDILLTGGFLNLTLKKDQVAEQVIKSIKSNPNYGESTIGKGKTSIVEYSSPNIAKPFSVGHLRSTIIGHSIANLQEKCGFDVIRINHLGDWGTQFGKLIVAYQRWGSKDIVEQKPVEELLKLYIRFHEEAEQNPELEIEGRKAFAKLETGDEAYHQLWEWFRDESLKELMGMYDLLGVHFDSFKGEAFYVDQLDGIVEELKQKNLLKEDQGAHIVDLGEDIPPAIIQKTDGATLYITRDIAAALYRKNTYQFDQIYYVVGNEQSLHFEQLKRVIDQMGYGWSDQIHHVNFGLVMQGGKKMSTRKGRIVKLEEVIEEAVEMANHYMKEKNSTASDQVEVAKQIGVSAIIYNDLKNMRTNDIEFNLEQMLKFEGMTGPYLQYTSVRIHSILKSAKWNSSGSIHYELFKQDHYFDLIRLLSKFEKLIQQAALEANPSIIAKYAYQLASSFNTFYGKERIIVEDILEMNTKLSLAYSVKQVLDECLKLLGMKVVEEM